MTIIQVLIAPDNSTWQGILIGLGDNGIVYRAENKVWVVLQLKLFSEVA